MSQKCFLYLFSVNFFVHNLYLHLKFEYITSYSLLQLHNIRIQNTTEQTTERNLL